MRAEAWRSARRELARFVVERLVNRATAFGRYTADGGQYTDKGCLSLEIIEQHFAATGPVDIIGLHTTLAEEIEGPGGEMIVSCTSKFCNNDIDHHGDGDAPAINFKAALAWCSRAINLGFRPLLVDTNGNGGYRVWILFNQPVRTPLAYHLIRWLQRDWKDFGFATEPECFPKQPGIALDGFGNWVRLFGRHHRRDHYTRFWDYVEGRWLEGQEAIVYLTAHPGDDPRLIPQEVHDLARAEAGRKPACEAAQDKDFSDLLVATEALGSLKHLADDYDSWVMIGQCLTALGDAGLGLWDAWSKTAKNGTYAPGECAEKWATFKTPDKVKGRGGRNLGTLLHLAEQEGFRGHKSVSAAPKGGTRTATTATHEEPILRKDGSWISCVHNARLWLEGRGKAIKYDTFRNDITVDGTGLQDHTVIDLTAEIESDTRTGWAQEHVRSAVVSIGRRNAYSSLVDWLDSLEWDGVERLDWFFVHAFGCKDTSYVRACGRVCLLSAAARAYHPGCQSDVMVVLTGKQGIGKSTGMAALCARPEWYADDLGCDLFAAKPGEGLKGKWLVEFSEFSRINRASMEVVKAFLTRRSDYYRPAYARTHEDFPRSCIFYGTTNEQHPLHDEENRRFMPLAVKRADFKWIAEHRSLLWAEAASRVKKGEKWWVTDPTLLAQVATKQAAARQHDAWESILADKLRPEDRVRLEDAAAALDIRPDRLDRTTQVRLGKCLRALGYERKKVRQGDKLAWLWLKV